MNRSLCLDADFANSECMPTKPNQTPSRRLSLRGSPHPPFNPSSPPLLLFQSLPSPGFPPFPGVSPGQGPRLRAYELVARGHELRTMSEVSLAFGCCICEPQFWLEFSPRGKALIRGIGDRRPVPPCAPPPWQGAATGRSRHVIAPPSLPPPSPPSLGRRRDRQAPDSPGRCPGAPSAHTG